MRALFRTLLYVVVLSGVSQARAGSYEDFFQAVARDDAPAVGALLQRGFDPNTRDPKGQVGLFLALQAQALKAAEALLKHPSIDVDAANLNAETPLMMAALRGQLDWCKRLVARGASVSRDGWTPLHYAAAGPNADAVTWLVAQRAPLDARSPNGTTPLMMAAGYGTEKGADVLLGAGADARLRNLKDMSAADFARSVGRDALAVKIDRATR
jgi:ankyrin repeat protein